MSYSSPSEGFEDLLERSFEQLYGYQEGSFNAVEDIEKERYVIFPYGEDLDDVNGLRVLGSEETYELLEEEKSYPLMRTLDMSMERVNVENRRGGNLLVAKIEDGELREMGYSMEDGEILAAWPFSQK